MKLFELGQIVATPGAMELLKRENIDPLHFITRHASGDWGDLDAEDYEANQIALKESERLMSVYVVNNEKLWVITEWDRSVTTLLLPSEY